MPTIYYSLTEVPLPTECETAEECRITIEKVERSPAAYACSHKDWYAGAPGSGTLKKTWQARLERLSRRENKLLGE